MDKHLVIQEFVDRTTQEVKYRIVYNLGAGLSLAARPCDSLEAATNTAREICRRLDLDGFTLGVALVV